MMNHFYTIAIPKYKQLWEYETYDEEPTKECTSWLIDMCSIFHSLVVFHLSLENLNYTWDYTSLIAIT